MKQKQPFLAASILVVMLTACSSDSDEQPKENGNEDSNKTIVSTLSVETLSAEILVKKNTIFASGTVAAKQTSNIGALTAGVIEEVFVKVGDRVTKGQPLFRTRTIDYELRLDEALSALEISKAEASDTRAILARYSGLNDSRAVAQVELDGVKKRNSIAKAEVALRETQVRSATQALEDTTVKAPFSGAITGRYVDEGVYLTNTFSGMGNSSVVQVQECGIAAAILFAPESVLGLIRKGLTGKLEIDGQSEISTEITIINDRVDTTTRQVEFRMPFLNPDCSVKAGQSVRVGIEVESSTVLTLPRKVLHGSDLSQFVWLAENGKAVRRDIQARDHTAQLVEVISGVTASDKIISSHFELLSEGTLLESNSR